MTLTRDEILTFSELRTERVAVPEWGGEVIVRELTGDERDQWEAELVDLNPTDSGAPDVTVKSMRGARARLASLAIVDDAGERLFTDEDVEQLGKLSAAALARVFERASKLSGLTDADIEELAGN